MTVHFPGLVQTFQNIKSDGVILISCNQLLPEVRISNVVDFASVDVRNKLIICIINNYVTYLKEESMHGM